MIPPSYHQHFIQVSTHQHLLQDDRHFHLCLLRISIASISANAQFMSSPPPSLPDLFEFFPTIIPSDLLYFVDAAYTNNLQQHRSTTGYALTLTRVTFIYRYKTQSVTTLSGTDTAIFDAVSASKVILYINSILRELNAIQVLLCSDSDIIISTLMFKSGGPVM